MYQTNFDQRQVFPLSDFGECRYTRQPRKEFDKPCDDLLGLLKRNNPGFDSPKDETTRGILGNITLNL